MFARCGHDQNVDDNVYYESLLLKGQHIGISFESSNSDLSEKMAMLQISVMPPSEALIRSKGMRSKNEGKFYFATKADHDLYSKMRKKPAVPVIVDMGEGLVLKKCFDRQIQLAIAFNDKIPVEGSSLEEDQNSENKRIPRKEKAQKRNAQKNEVGRPFGKYQTE
nr:RING/U-box superfamily protein [Tanacetum cinerariifolium]